MKPGPSQNHTEPDFILCLLGSTSKWSLYIRDKNVNRNINKKEDRNISMSNSQLPPYPTPQEIVRVLANAFDTKHSNKKLDELNRDIVMDCRLLPEMVEKSIVSPISKHISESLGRFISVCMESIFEEYFVLIKQCALDRVPRNIAVAGICEHFFAWQATSIVESLYSNFLIDPRCLLSPTSTALDCVFASIEQRVLWWGDFYFSCTKEQKDRFAVWRKGEELPSWSSIILLHEKADNSASEQEWEIIKSWILIARAVDELTSNPIGRSAQQAIHGYLGMNSYVSGKALSKLQQLHSAKFVEQIKLTQEISPLLLQSDKGEAEKALADEKLQQLEKLQQADELDGQMTYWTSRYRALWYVFSGDLESAHICYKSAFEQAIYRAGIHVPHIISEAIVVASSLKHPDKVFLKRLKNMGAMFSWEFLPSKDADTAPRSRADEFIEDWEIEAYRARFSVCFPRSSMFSGSPYPAPEKPKSGIWLVDRSTKILPDFRKPDKKINVGSGDRKKRMPQLVWFSIIEDIDAIKGLLDKGAQVNVQSKDGETPLLMTLQAMDMTLLPLNSMDDAAFWLIAEQEHAKSIIELKTKKRKISPLITAVATGRPKIVRKLLEMGASVDYRANTADETPLNACLKLIGMLNNPEKHLSAKGEVYCDNPSLVLDGARRYLPGVIPNDKIGGKAHLDMLKQDSPDVARDVHKAIVENVNRFGKLEEQREIARMLLDHGACPNALQYYPLTAYTPLMLAAELNESELFQKMLDCGGDPSLLYYSHGDTKHFNCMQIAETFGSNQVAEILREKAD